MAGTTALLRKIELQDQAAVAAAWEERRAANEGQRRRRPKWAVDHLLDTGQITAGQHDAAQRLQRCLIAAAAPPHLGAAGLVAIHPAWDLTVATEVDRVARLWDAAQSREIARTARSWVSAAPYSTQARMRLYDRLFELPAVTWSRLTKSCNARDRERCIERASSLLDVVCAFWSAQGADALPRVGMAR